jgi:hypothetical protein
MDAHLDIPPLCQWTCTPALGVGPRSRCANATVSKHGKRKLQVNLDFACGAKLQIYVIHGPVMMRVPRERCGGTGKCDVFVEVMVDPGDSSSESDTPYTHIGLYCSSHPTFACHISFYSGIRQPGNETYTNE